MQPKRNILKIVVGFMMIGSFPQILTMYFTDPIVQGMTIILILGCIFFLWGIFLVYTGFYPSNTN